MKYTKNKTKRHTNRKSKQHKTKNNKIKQRKRTKRTTYKRKSGGGLSSRRKPPSLSLTPFKPQKIDTSIFSNDIKVVNKDVQITKDLILDEDKLKIEHIQSDWNCIS